MSYKTLFFKSHQEISLIFLNPSKFKNFGTIYALNLTRQPKDITVTRKILF